MPATRKAAVVGIIGCRLSVYDPATDSWQERNGSLRRHRTGVAGVIDGRLWVTGSTEGISYEECEVYDPATDEWSLLNPMPVARCDATAAVVNGHLWILGGCFED